eukprot:4792383-Pleurochrysis_carterae.AAC.1
MRGKHSQVVRERCASLACKESNISGGALGKSAGQPAKGDRKSERRRSPRGSVRTHGGQTGDGRGRVKTERTRRRQRRVRETFCGD